MRDQVRKAVFIDILRVPVPLVHRLSFAGTQKERGHVHIRHVEGLRTEDGHRDDSAAEGVDRVALARRLDVDRNFHGHNQPVEHVRPARILAVLVVVARTDERGVARKRQSDRTKRIVRLAIGG